MSELYRLVYASKNLLQGSDEEIVAGVEQILAASQRNNAVAGVTGALMFNAGAFAQVLEGPRKGVEETFERIQCDVRHGDVTVLQCGPTLSRSFANWSMAFAGQSARGQAQFSGLAAESGFDLSRLDGDAVFAMLHELVLEEEGVQPSDRSAPSIAPALVEVPTEFDVRQIRAEIAQLVPNAAAPRIMSGAGEQQEVVEDRAPNASSPVEGRRAPAGAADAALHVLKAALMEERQRTNDLRSEIDTLRIAMAACEDRLELMREERDLWASRAALLAAAMSQEAGAVRHAASRFHGKDASSGGETHAGGGIDSRAA